MLNFAQIGCKCGQQQGQQAQAGNGNPQQKGDHGEKGNQPEKNNSQNAKPESGNQQNGNPQNGNQQANAEPRQNGAPKSLNGNQRSAAGSEPKGDHRGQPAAKLDEQSARALLRALKGEERHAIRTGADGGASQPDEDTPKKDW